MQRKPESRAPDIQFISAVLLYWFIYYMAVNLGSIKAMKLYLTELSCFCTITSSQSLSAKANAIFAQYWSHVFHLHRKTV